MAVVAGVLFVPFETETGEHDLVAAEDSTPTTVPPTTAPYVPPTTVTSAVPEPTVPATTVATIPPDLVFSATSETLSIEVTIRPGAGLTGELLRFETKVTDTAGGRFATGGTFGDDGSMLEPRLHVHCDEGASGSTQTTTKTYVEDHAYRVAGAYLVEAVAVSADCGRERRRVHVSQSITIGPGVVLANGPLPIEPEAIPEPVNGRDPSLVYVSATAMDGDGYVREIVVDWGDGTPPAAIPFPLAECTDPGSTYPFSSVGESLSHQYASSGMKTIIITATSSGCDGTDIQTASTTETVTAP